jgi:hypothetical protein
MPIREVHVMDFPTGKSCLQHGLGFSQRLCQRFFTKDVLAISKSSYGLIGMECIRSGYRDCLDIGLRAEFPVIRIDSRDTELFGYRVRAVVFPPADGHNFRL